jgi:hypothetical protein
VVVNCVKLNEITGILVAMPKRLRGPIQIVTNDPKHVGQYNDMDPDIQMVRLETKVKNEFFKSYHDPNDLRARSRMRLDAELTVVKSELRGE